jgi:hypothetical protein
MVASSGKVQFGSSSKRPTASSPRGRVCEVGECPTVLSIYNHSVWCSVHEQPASRNPISPRPWGLFARTS